MILYLVAINALYEITVINAMGLFYLGGLTLIPTWISSIIHPIVCSSEVAWLQITGAQ